MFSRRLNRVRITSHVTRNPNSTSLPPKREEHRLDPSCSRNSNESHKGRDKLRDQLQIQRLSYSKTLGPPGHGKTWRLGMEPGKPNEGNEEWGILANGRSIQPTTVTIIIVCRSIKENGHLCRDTNLPDGSADSTDLHMEL